MASYLDITRMCRLCLVKDEVNMPIFGGQGDIQQIFLKITACLPVKVSRDDNLPKKICDGCSYKLDMLYQFWNTSSNAEKQLIDWLNEAGVDPKHKSLEINPLAIPTQAHVILKQEPINEAECISNDAQSYIIQQQQLAYKAEEYEAGQQTTQQKCTKKKATEPAAESPSKRPRRATRSTKIESDEDDNDEEDEEEDEDEEETMENADASVAKTEEEDEEDDDGDDDDDGAAGDADFDGLEEDADQPGPSGVSNKAASGPYAEYGDQFEEEILIQAEPDPHFQCEVCSAFFEDRNAYLEHRVSQFGSRFRCCRCGISFKNTTALYQHYEAHKSEPEQEYIISKETEIDEEDEEEEEDDEEDEAVGTQIVVYEDGEAVAEIGEDEEIETVMYDDEQVEAVINIPGDNIKSTQELLYILDDDNQCINEVIIETGDQAKQKKTLKTIKKAGKADYSVVQVDHGYIIPACFQGQLGSKARIKKIQPSTPNTSTTTTTYIEFEQADEEQQENKLMVEMAATTSRAQETHKHSNARSNVGRIFQARKRHELPDFSATSYEVITPNEEVDIVHYRCLRCEQIFINKFVFFRHIEKGKCYINSCDVCPLSFEKNSDFYRHYLSAHTERAICNFCFRTFMYEKNVKEHMLRHLDQFRHRCEECNKGFYTVREYRNHYKNRHMGIRHKCAECGRTFADEYYFKKHIATHGLKLQLSTTLLVTDEYGKIKAYYGLKECIVFVGDALTFDNAHFRFMRTQSVCDLTTRNIIVEPRMKYRCEDCGSRFRDHYRLILHREAEHAADEASNSSDEGMEPDEDYEPEDEEEDDDDDDFVPIEPKVEITTDPDKSVKLNSIVEQTLFEPDTEHSSASAYALSDSLFANISAKPTEDAPLQKVFACGKCSVISYSKVDHNMHMKAAHNFYTCDVCPQSFFSKNNMQFHMKLKHPKEYRRTANALICEHCELRMDSVASLIKHKQIGHHIRKDLLCIQCGLTALSVSDLEMHCKFAHKDGGAYKCYDCGSTFKECDQLKIHIDQHRNGCDICEKEMSNVEALIAHKLHEHKAEPGSICYICAFMCTKANKLKKHMEGHGCLFRCQFCYSNFAKQDELWQHEQTKHNWGRRYKCGKCNRAYTNKGALEHHLKTDHRVAERKKPATVQQPSTGGVPTILNHTQQLPRINETAVQMTVGNSVIMPNSTAAAGPSNAPQAPDNAPVKFSQQASKESAIIVLDKNNQAFLVPGGIVVNENGLVKLSVKGGALPEGARICPDQIMPTLTTTTSASKSQTATIAKSTPIVTKPEDIKFMPALVQRRYDKKSEPTTSQAPKTLIPLLPAQEPIPPKLMEPQDTELEYFGDEDGPKEPPVLEAFDSPALTSTQETTDENKEDDSQPPALETSQEPSAHRPKIFLKPLSQLLEKPGSKDAPTLTPSSTTPPASKPGPSNQPRLTKITADKVPEYIRKVNNPGTVIKPKQSSSVEDVINKIATGTYTEEDPKKTYTCVGCNVVFKRLYKYQQHHKKFKCKLCEYTGCKVKDLDNHYRTLHNFKNQCITCDIKFPSSVELQAHNKVVHFCTKCSKFYTSITKHSTMFKCIRCGDFECSVAKLSEHYAEKHGIKHTCTPCNEIYSTPEEFTKHKKDVHYCTNCKSFKMNLALHVRFCKRGPEPEEVIGVDDSD